MHKSSDRKTLKKPEDLGADGLDTIKFVLKLLNCNCMDRIHQAQDRGQLLASVNTVMNVQLPYNAENFFTK
jgi:hypothetical protein